ncbi:MAG: DUF3793 family protein [Anaerovoracaceae bacterium]
MSLDKIIRHCAPTLAGLKIGNLFSYKYESEEQLLESVDERNLELNNKGVYFEILKAINGVALIYVYRKNRLWLLFQNRVVKEFMQEFGYNNLTVENALEILKIHLLKSDFPHEIGVFLGYPLEDIKAFIVNKGENYKCVGCWKVYSNICDAEKTFGLFRKCTRIYCEKLSEGSDLKKLTVAI